MRVIILSVGTRGDVEPFCALARHLIQQNQKQSYRVDFFVQTNLIHIASHLEQCCTSNEMATSLIKIHALPFTNQDFYSAVAANETSTPSIETQDPRMKSVAQVSAIISHLVLPCYDQVEKVLLTPFQNPETDDTNNSNSVSADPKSMIVTSFLARPLAFLLAKVHGTRAIVINLQPTVPNSMFPSYRVSVNDFVRAIMKLELENATPLSNSCCNAENCNEDYAETYWRIEKALECTFLADRMETIYNEKAIRYHGNHSSASRRYYSWEELQKILSGQNDRFVLVNAYSNFLVPSLANEFSINVHDVGPLADAYLPPGEPSTSLVEFLDNTTFDRRPICVGFGSMKFSRSRTLLEALESIKQPAVLVGSSLRNFNLEKDQDPNQKLQDFLKFHIYCASNVPYAWLLPRCSMMICHGGAGVVHACLRAGIPCVVLPVMGDQFAWGALLEAKGLGVVIKPRRHLDLTIQDFVDAIESVFLGDDRQGNKRMVDKCRCLGEIIQKQKPNGVQALADLMEAI
jgi:UDP:flavonoid glycosyltransferase YjiC (YdhE family)